MPIATAPSAFHIMAKPRGAVCNLECAYCFFLKKEKLYPGSNFRMSDEVLESYLRQVIEAHQGRRVTIAWQGGEPTLMGLDFFRKSIEYQRKYQKPGTIIENTIQTNGVLLNKEWCSFLHANKFLVGLSLDGPKELHDVYRRDKAGRSVSDAVMQAARLMQQHQVDFNILATVNAANADYPLDVYRFFRDEVGAEFIQFIPIVERDNESGSVEGKTVTNRSVRPEQYGCFLNAVFDEWIRRDVGRIFVNHFDAALASWAGAPPATCTTAPTCGFAMVLEHNGDLYSCDHFVERNHLLGNIMEQPLIELATSEKQRTFGQNKRDTLPRYCRECEVLVACHGECPKNRLLRTPDGEPGLNYLCTGLKSFFAHIDRPMRIMAELLRKKRAPAEVMQMLAVEEARLKQEFAKASRNEPCPCGSGLKFKRCHGKN
ncbi:MAG: anaerobic sulfatase maturase [Candidatus Abyssobacteria bacterium SURF_17]|uniref:Anaerobic sulfatase maturase n=1 Tax=Candidatus Abyssobacteria bacterium SURF_17 TaxID=2093361 RepID=A0A419EPM9_9BACT|nr:MAG: anaerobic sulfatase maturase [Candidatus Abyssubacteria bacterium SURF_17]